MQALCATFFIMVGGLAAKLDVENAYEQAAVGVFQTTLAVVATVTTLLAIIAGNWTKYKDHGIVKRLVKLLRKQRDRSASYAQRTQSRGVC